MTRLDLAQVLYGCSDLTSSYVRFAKPESKVLSRDTAIIKALYMLKIYVPQWCWAPSSRSWSISFWIWNCKKLIGVFISNHRIIYIPCLYNASVIVRSMLLSRPLAFLRRVHLYLKIDAWLYFQNSLGGAIHQICIEEENSKHGLHMSVVLTRDGQSRTFGCSRTQHFESRISDPFDKTWGILAEWHDKIHNKYIQRDNSSTKHVYYSAKNSSNLDFPFWTQF